MIVANFLEKIEILKNIDEFAYEMFGAIACNSSMKLSHNCILRDVLYDNNYKNKHGVRIVEPELVGLLDDKDLIEISKKSYIIIQKDYEQEMPLEKNDFWYEYLNEWYNLKPEEILYYVPSDFAIEYERKAIELYTGKPYFIEDIKKHKELIMILKDIIMKFRELKMYCNLYK